MARIKILFCIVQLFWASAIYGADTTCLASLRQLFGGKSDSFGGLLDQIVAAGVLDPAVDKKPAVCDCSSASISRPYLNANGSQRFVEDLLRQKFRSDQQEIIRLMHQLAGKQKPASLLEEIISGQCSADAAGVCLTAADLVAKQKDLERTTVDIFDRVLIDLQRLNLRAIETFPDRIALRSMTGETSSLLAYTQQLRLAYVNVKAALQLVYDARFTQDTIRKNLGLTCSGASLFGDALKGDAAARLRATGKDVEIRLTQVRDALITFKNKARRRITELEDKRIASNEGVLSAEDLKEKLEMEALFKRLVDLTATTVEKPESLLQAILDGMDEKNIFSLPP